MVQKFVLAVTAGLFLAVASVSPANAQVVDDRSFFTFSQPVGVPGGGVLEPGRYMFRLADWDTGRKVVQVLNEDMTQVYGLFYTQQVLRANPPAVPEMSLGEAPEGQPRSLSTWWQAGEVYGRAFLYAPGEASWERDATVARSDD